MYSIIIFLIFTCIVIICTLVYFKFTMWPAPSCLDSSVGRAMHLYRRHRGFRSHSSLNFSVVYTTVIINHVFMYSIVSIKEIQRDLLLYRSWYLQADSDSLRDEWMEAMQVS